MKKLFIGNCDYNVDEAALREFIEGNGLQVSSVQIIRDRYTERSRGFGFVELSGSEDVEKAIETLNGKELEGRAITVNLAREPKPRYGPDMPDGGGGGGRGRSFGGGGGGGGGGRGRGGKGRGRGSR